MPTKAELARKLAQTKEELREEKRTRTIILDSHEKIKSLQRQLDCANHQLEQVQREKNDVSNQLEQVRREKNEVELRNQRLNHRILELVNQLDQNNHCLAIMGGNFEHEKKPDLIKTLKIKD